MELITVTSGLDIHRSCWNARTYTPVLQSSTPIESNLFPCSFIKLSHSKACCVKPPTLYYYPINSNPSTHWKVHG